MEMGDCTDADVFGSRIEQEIHDMMWYEVCWTEEKTYATKVNTPPKALEQVSASAKTRTVVLRCLGTLEWISASVEGMSTHMSGKQYRGAKVKEQIGLVRLQ